uniref:Serpin domain-containing protein n=1 Tax=Mola mola TaxID=94237 RepID=A0A3Q3XDC7_MOLML
MQCYVSMRGIIASCTLAALLLAVASAVHHHRHHQHHQHHHLHHDDDVACYKLSPANARFSLALYKSLSAKSAAGKNIFFSPLGISSALTMLSKGARGETHRQLVSTLGYSAFNQSEVDEAYQHLFQMLNPSEGNQELSFGNAAAVSRSFNPLGSYVSDVSLYYSGKVFDVNFREPANAAAEINRYIAQNTRDMIKDQVKDLDPDTAMVLINYIYFSGAWEKPFNANRTKKANFHVDETTKVKVDMMKRTGRYYFYQDDDNHTSVIMLHYKGNTSMMIVLPYEGKMKEVENYLTREHLNHWHDSLYRTSVDLSMPKFSINADASLDSTLKEMGIADAFSDQADFSGISDETKLKVSKVSHRAVLSVDEKGTTAAASTTIEVMPMSMPEIMKLDRPFLVFILEESTSNILFMGKITNPTSM